MPVEDIFETILVGTSCDKVIRAILSEERWPEWWALGWNGCKIVLCEIREEKGGTFRLESETKRGETHWVEGTFLHVSDRLLVFTWDSDLSEAEASTVFLEFEPETENRTKLTLTHRGLTRNVERSRLKNGWTGILNAMAVGIPRSGESPEVQSYLDAHPKCR